MYLYIIRYAREKWVNMAWYLHNKELGLNNKEQDIFMDKKIKALFFATDAWMITLAFASCELVPESSSANFSHEVSVATSISKRDASQT